MAMRWKRISAFGAIPLIASSISPPALTPLGFDPAHPFQFISNLSTSWGFVLRAPGTDHRLPVRVKSPTELPQWLPLHADVPAGERRFVSLETLIRNNAAVAAEIAVALAKIASES